MGPLQRRHRVGMMRTHPHTHTRRLKPSLFFLLYVAEMKIICSYYVFSWGNYNISLCHSKSGLLIRCFHGEPTLTGRQTTGFPPSQTYRLQPLSSSQQTEGFSRLAGGHSLATRLFPFGGFEELTFM